MNRFKLWKRWKKDNRNSFLYQILVLFGIKDSPTFDMLIAFHAFWDGYNRK